jgi:hypothetical protein
MKLAPVIAAVLLTSISPAYAKAARHASAHKSSGCPSRAYDIDALFECDHDEFIAPSFSASRSLCHGEDVGIAILEFNNGTGSGTHFLAKKIAKSCFKPAYRKWADSRKCPQLIAVVKSEDRIALPRQKLPSDQEFGREMDGSFFKVELNGFYPKERTLAGITLTGQDYTPIGRWVDTALRVLEPCWSDKRPPR